jgi:hypothetical protein
MLGSKFPAFFHNAYRVGFPMLQANSWFKLQVSALKEEAVK